VRSLLLRMDEDTKPLINPMRYSDPSPVPNLWSAMGMEDRSPSEEPEQPEPEPEPEPEVMVHVMSPAKICCYTVARLSVLHW